MLRHVVMMKLVDDATPAQRQAIMDGLSTMPGLVPEIRNYSIGSDAGLVEGNFDVVVVADFDDVAGFDAYSANSAHVALIADHIRPVAAGRSAVQYEL